VWSMRHARFRWCGWFLGLRAELHCNHNYKEEGGKRSLDRCESKVVENNEVQLTN
jgi:hypothetical protein